MTRFVSQNDLATGYVSADAVNKNAATGFSAWLAVKITDGEGTMWCDYIFAIVAFIGLHKPFSSSF
jgi:hypothetical protein